MSDWFKKLNIKFKLALGLIGLFLSMLLFAAVQKKFSAKDKLRYELERVEHETNLAHLEKDENIQKDKIKVLEVEKEELLRQLDLIELEEIEIGKEISVFDLDKFFDERGF